MKANCVSNVKFLLRFANEPIWVGIVPLSLLTLNKRERSSSVNKAISAGIVPTRLLLIKLRLPARTTTSNECEGQLYEEKEPTKVYQSARERLTNVISTKKPYSMPSALI